jgi:TIR domain
MAEDSERQDEKLKVFVSYARDDLEFADQLVAALDAFGFEALIDRHGISAGEDWKRRLGALIAEADTVVFLLSRSALRSTMCDWEIEETDRLSKRLLPILIKPLDTTPVPERFQELNYIFLYPEPKAPGSGFGQGLADLVQALNTDLGWVREHTAPRPARRRVAGGRRVREPSAFR